MKYKTTNKAVNNGYYRVLRVPYCALQNLLCNVSPVAYTCGAYGWNSDIYAFGNIAISTGYRPTGEIEPDYDTMRLFNDRAREIWNYKTPGTYDEKSARISALIREFIGTVLS